MKKRICITFAAVLFAAITMTAKAEAPTVSSYAAPKLIEEINTGFSTLYSYVFTNTASGITVGNLPVAQITNAVMETIMPAYSAGVFAIADTTQLVFIASGVTNIVDSDITSD